MTLPLALVLIGSLLVYAGIKGLSIRQLLVGDNLTPSRKPGEVQR